MTTQVQNLGELLAEYNGLMPDDQKIKKWTGSAEDLETKIEDLRREERKRSSLTIKDLSTELLLTVDYEDDRTKRRVGLPYDEILRRIKKQFPQADTTDKCLRWYAVHLNREPDVRMPYRPRRRTPKKKKAA